MLDQQAPVPRLNKAIVLLMGLYTAHLCLHLCASAFIYPLSLHSQGGSAAVASIWHQRHLAVILHIDQTFFYCINQFVKCQDWILE